MNWNEAFDVQKTKTAKNMREYGFSVIRILSYRDKILYGSVKTRILAYFMQ